ncbi:MAG: hypothetical protein SVV80_03355 [Planctomycetota bacterium]|nr:hypothetical protein [Planctomycetota bacterium]
MNSEHPVVTAFHRAAEQTPAYRRILEEANLSPEKVKDTDDFRRLVPVIDKQKTFGRFALAELCRGGKPGRPAAVLTSSGHSGKFAFSLYDAESAETEIRRTDEALDALFSVKSRKTLMINCLPMGVKVFTRACTLGETSVRADMVTALVKNFGPYYDQIILVGDAAFIKHVLELGLSLNPPIDWSDLLVHVIVGEEPLAENARKYLQGILGIDNTDPNTGLIGSSMGVAELGLNLLFETPPLIFLRRALHDNEDLRRVVLGPTATTAPMLLTYDPDRIFVEVSDDGKLLVSTLETDRRIPLIRYATGDKAELFRPAGELQVLVADAVGIPPDVIAATPTILLSGRGQFALAGETEVYPEQVKEGLYLDPELAGLITANFRLFSGPQRADLRIQLSPGIADRKGLAERFAEAVAKYVHAPLAVTCHAYESFKSGMGLDYERKFAYLKRE